MRTLTLPQARCIHSPAMTRRRPIITPRCTGKGFGPKEATKPPGKSSTAGPQKEAEGSLDSFSAPRRSPAPPQPSPPPVQEVPEVVNQRMLNRMLTFSLLPVLLGFLSLPLLAYVQVGLKVDLPTGTAFAVSGLFFFIGIMGITYGIMSASWDENQEGSALGLEQFKSNTAPLVDRIKNGPKR